MAQTCPPTLELMTKRSFLHITENKPSFLLHYWPILDTKWLWGKKPRGSQAAGLRTRRISECLTTANRYKSPALRRYCSCWVSGEQRRQKIKALRGGSIPRMTHLSDPNQSQEGWHTPVTPASWALWQDDFLSSMPTCSCSGVLSPQTLGQVIEATAVGFHREEDLRYTQTSSAIHSKHFMRVSRWPVSVRMLKIDHIRQTFWSWKV